MNYYIIKDDEGYLQEMLFKKLEDARKYALAAFHRDVYSSVMKFSIYHIDTREVSMYRCENVYRDTEEEEEAL